MIVRDSYEFFLEFQSLFDVAHTLLEPKAIKDILPKLNNGQSNHPLNCTKCKTKTLTIKGHKNY